MSNVSSILEKSNTWDTICYPVREERLQSLLPEGYRLLPSDRQRAIVGTMPDGQQNIFALQSNEYTLISNDFLRSVVEEVISDYTIDARHTPGGDFSINIVLPDSLKVGDERIYKNLIVNNSYTGKSPFNIQGSSIESTNEEKVKVSYYRQICANGLMGWCDEFMSLEEYFDWLANGQPKKYLDALKEKTEQVNIERRKETLVMAETFHHKGLDLEYFREHLTSILRNFIGQSNSITGAAYNKLIKVALPNDEDVQHTIAQTGLPKRLAAQAVERMRYEEQILQTEANLWLLYNAANFALFHGKTALSISERFKADQKAFNNIAALAY